MVKKVVISAPNNNKAIAFFAEIDRKKAEAKARFSAHTSRVRELLIKKNSSN